METAPKYQTRQDFETSRTILDDPRLSYRAIGIALYLISKSDDEIVTLDDLTSAHSEGKVAARNALRELADAGYLKRERVYEAGRKGVKTITHVAEEPIYYDVGTPKTRLHGYSASDYGRKKGA